MPDDLNDILGARAPDPTRPLAGLTILVVEDSRFACEALRLLCLRSGARIRRADCLASARRHLQTYRPSVLIVDLGLPDGSGLELIADLNGHTPRVPAILATSGDDLAAGPSLAAGADGFLSKPVGGLRAFQQAILGALPQNARPFSCGMRLEERTPADDIAPDRIALRDDLALAEGLLLSADAGARDLAYVAQFLSGVARIAKDDPLAEASAALSHDPGQGRSLLTGMVRQRLDMGARL